VVLGDIRLVTIEKGENYVQRSYETEEKDDKCLAEAMLTQPLLDVDAVNVI
jgi:hypothetical protein